MPVKSENRILYTLDNGIRVVLENLPGRFSASMGIWLPVGSSNEIIKQNGYAHFTEHMLFKGTESRSYSEISRSIDKRGGHMNASTSKESTSYYIQIASKFISEGLDVLSDMFFKSVFDEKEFETEKKVILEEIKMTQDAPDDYIFDLFFQDYFGDTPYGRSIGGSLEGIERSKRDDLYDFYCRYYQTDGLVLSMAGSLWNSDSDKKKLMADINKYFNRQRENCGAPYEPEKVQNMKEDKTLAHKKDLSQLHFVYALPGVPYQFSGDEYMSVFTHFLGGSMSSRLVQKLREENGLCYSVGAFHSQSLNDGVWGVYAGTSTEYFSLSMELLNQEISTILKKPEYLKQIEESISGVIGSTALSMESTHRVASFNAKSVINFNRLRNVEDRISRVEKLQHDEIIDKVSDLWQGADYHISTLGNLSQNELESVRKNFPISL